MNTKIFEELQIQRFINAVKIGGIEEDAFCNAFDLLDSDVGECDIILNLYESLSSDNQKLFLQKVRLTIEKGVNEDNLYDLSGFDMFLR